MSPFSILQTWLLEELAAGAAQPQHAVLSTCSTDGHARGRVVAIREISNEGLLFFTQTGTRKVTELTANPDVALTFWFERLQREVIIEGRASRLTAAENEYYWNSYPRWSQIRFYSYAETSGQPIIDKQLLENKKTSIEENYQGIPLPMSPFYCGFRIHPMHFIFYAYLTDQLSDVFDCSLINSNWIKRSLSP